MALQASRAATFDSAGETEAGFSITHQSSLSCSTSGDLEKTTQHHEPSPSPPDPNARCTGQWNPWLRGSAAGLIRGVQRILKPLKPNLSPSKSENIQINKLESHPDGYPGLSWFLSSDESFTMYRGFNQLQSRILLQKQDELRELEENLRAYDHEDDRDESTQRYLQSRVLDQKRPKPVAGRNRTDVLRDIDQKLEEYTRCLSRAQFVQSMNKPTDRDHSSVSNYFTIKGPLVERERGFVEMREDLVSLRSGREHTWLDGLIEAMLRWYPCVLTKAIFQSRESREKTSDKRFHYYSRKRINILVTMLITCLVSFLLVGPTFALFYLTVSVGTTLADNTCIALLLVCTMVFSIVLSLFTKAKRHEILAAAVAYCAVLVVFVANIGNIRDSGPQELDHRLA